MDSNLSHGVLLYLKQVLSLKAKCHFFSEVPYLSVLAFLNCSCGSGPLCGVTSRVALVASYLLCGSGCLPSPKVCGGSVGELGLTVASDMLHGAKWTGGPDSSRLCQQPPVLAQCCLPNTQFFRSFP